MAFYLRDLRIVETLEELSLIPSGKIMINCINANSYNIAQNNEVFAKALKNSDYLIPDGISIVMACKWLKTPNMPKKRIVGWDLFELEMNKLTHHFQNSNSLTLPEVNLLSVKILTRLSKNVIIIQTVSLSPHQDGLRTGSSNSLKSFPT